MTSDQALQLLPYIALFVSWAMGFSSGSRR